MDPAILAIAPPLHVGVISKSRLVDPVDLPFMVEAVRVQVRDQVCPAYRLKPVNVAAYQDGARLPPDLAAVVYLVDDDGNPASLGYHAEIGGLVYGFVDVRQTLAKGLPLGPILSHEVIETVLNSRLKGWVWIASRGLFYWREPCDPVQDITYGITVEVEGLRRTIQVSDFVLPEWYDPTFRGPADFRATLRALAITEGGYQVGRDLDGRIVALPDGSPVAAAALMDKKVRMLSRLSRSIEA